LASAFQLWEQDGASVGNYHAGYAAEANDASTAFYNPAGITRIKNQQLVISADSVMTDFKYQGTIGVNTILAGAPRPVTAQGGNYSLVPALHYVAPLNDWMGFGFSVDVPFGLKTTYGRKTILQYAATTTAATVVDISPSLGFKIFKKASLGFGLDIQRMYAQFDQVGGLSLPTLNAEGLNKANDTGYGGHFGVLYEFSSKTRMGLSYHTQVVHHLNGSSSFVGPLAIAFSDNGKSYSSHAYTNITLPAYTALSGYKQISNRVAIMASAIYTQWNIFKNLSVRGVSGVAGLDESTNITVTVPEYYRNTWNLTVGADYFATDKIIVRGGAGYDQTPVQSRFRNVTLPDNNRVAVALGGHYQSTKELGFDLGWTHFFVNQANINPPPQKNGDQIVVTNGVSKGGADVLAAQVTWDMT
jgi:long-chain fatty acid transport protein